MKVVGDCLHLLRLTCITLGLISIPYLVQQVSTIRDYRSRALEASKTTSSACADAGVLIVTHSDLLSAN